MVLILASLILNSVKTFPRWNFQHLSALRFPNTCPSRRTIKSFHMHCDWLLTVLIKLSSKQRVISGKEIYMSMINKLNLKVRHIKPRIFTLQLQITSKYSKERRIFNLCIEMVAKLSIFSVLNMYFDWLGLLLQLYTKNDKENYLLTENLKTLQISHKNHS